MIQASRILLLSALLIVGNAFAQLPTLPVSSDSAAEKPGESRVIPIGELPLRMVEESDFLQRVVEGSTSVVKADALEKELDNIKHDVDALGQRTLGKDFEALPLSGLEALERHLIFLGERLSRLHDDLQASTRPLSEDAGEVAQRRKLWQETRQTSAEMIPPTLLKGIDELDKEFQQAAVEASKPLAELIKLNRDAGLLSKRVSNGLSAVQNRIALVDRTLWRFDNDNLFSAVHNAGQRDEGTFKAVINGFAVQADFIKAFDQTARTRHILVGILALVSLPVFIYLSRWARRVINNVHTLERYRNTLNRPFSAWLLFIVMCLLLVDFDGPLLRLRLLLAIAWLPVMRLQPRWMHENIGHWIYSTALFFIISFCGHLITSFPLEYRLTLLFNGLVLLGSLAWLLRHVSANGKAKESRQRPIARTLIMAYIALVSFAVAANVLGGVQLAALLTEASINSLYLALFLLAVREFVRAYMHVLFTSSNVQARTEHAGRLFEVAFMLFNLAFVLVWSMVALNSLRVLGPLKSELYSVANFAIEFGSISITAGGVVLFCVSVFLSFWIAKTIRSVLREDVLPSMTLPRGVANSVSTMSYYLLLMLGLLVALSAAGFQLTQLALVVGALSVGIGFGLNTVVNNFVCGLILMIERPIQPGDIVELSGTTGRVRDIGIRTTTLSTFDGADVMVPNGMLLSEKLTNWTLNNDRRRIEIPLGVAYDSTPRDVQALLLAVASATEGVSHDPLPVALFMGFGESSLDFSVRAWTDNVDESQAIRSEMAIAIHAALKEAGIEIPFPQRDLNIRSLAPGLAVAEQSVVEPVPVASASPNTV